MSHSISCTQHCLDPPLPMYKGGVTWVLLALPPPPHLLDSSTATRVNNPGRQQGRAALRVSRGPSNRAANPPWDAT